MACLPVEDEQGIAEIQFVHCTGRCHIEQPSLFFETAVV
jgi:hypothetical protein